MPKNVSFSKNVFPEMLVVGIHLLSDELLHIDYHPTDGYSMLMLRQDARLVKVCCGKDAAHSDKFMAACLRVLRKMKPNVFHAWEDTPIQIEIEIKVRK